MRGTSNPSSHCFRPSQLAPQDVQNGRSARPQAKEAPEAYPLGYVEDGSEPRTKLAAVFNILLSRQARDFNHWPDLDSPLAGHGNLGGNADRLVEILGVDEEIAAQLLARLRERTIGHKPLSLPHPNAGRHGCGTQRVGSQVLPVRVKVMRKLRRFSVTVLSLRVSQPIFVTIDQQHVFHMDASCNFIVREESHVSRDRSY